MIVLCLSQSRCGPAEPAVGIDSQEACHGAAARIASLHLLSEQGAIGQDAHMMNARGDKDFTKRNQLLATAHHVSCNDT